MSYSEQILCNLPWLAFMWTGVSLAWGLYVGAAYTIMVRWANKKAGYIRKADLPHLWLIHLVNVLLLSYLWSANVLSFISNSIIVVNLFYNLLLFATTFEVIRWAKVKFVK